MSFFCDFLENFGLADIEGKIAVSLIFGVGITLIGNFKILELGEEKIVLGEKKDKYVVCGKNLVVKSISKGEIVVSGEIEKLELEKDK